MDKKNKAPIRRKFNSHSDLNVFYNYEFSLAFTR